jgi:beta-galactosidase
MLAARTILLVFALPVATSGLRAQEQHRILFDADWSFILDSTHNYAEPAVDDGSWRKLSLPHDWSIEGRFDSSNPAGTGGAALPGGVGWYRKTFSIPDSDTGQIFFIDFDGVYRNSEVWINGHYLGIRPNGYVSFRYELTPYLEYGSKKNVLAVKVDNGRQPNSRWYSGSGIYRHVWLIRTGSLAVDHWGTYLSTPKVSAREAVVSVRVRIRNSLRVAQSLAVRTTIYDESGAKVGSVTSELQSGAGESAETEVRLRIPNPSLWSVSHPYLYHAVTDLSSAGQIRDSYRTRFGIRYFSFSSDQGFSLNGAHLKINGVCDHHDLGCLGAAVNRAALRRQLEILQGMGCNAIRTSHNPPAPDLLDLCDEMGFLVMDEAFDMWEKPKTRYDYHLDWKQWHRQDLTDQVLRDRNHPSVIIWSIGNEIPEQWAGAHGQDSSGRLIARELSSLIRDLDTTRPITSACDHPDPSNNIIRSGALDLIGYNYHQQLYSSFLQTYPGKKFIGTETVSALETRGSYDMPSDSIRRWPIRWDIPFKEGNPDLSCSAYDNISAPWGSTHEETWKIIKKYPFLSGQFIWTGFDYLGEPTPYPWPARSSYFGLIDLAGFPKDLYYMYQSEWTDKPVLHVFPSWNWTPGDSVDIWAYFNHADEVELIVNGKSAGIRKKTGDDLHVSWRVRFEPGTLVAISRNRGKVVLERASRTAHSPYGIHLSADRLQIAADGTDLAFITAKVVDEDGNQVPQAGNQISFTVDGEAELIATDNGSETDLTSFQAESRKAFHGLCLAVLRSNGKPGAIRISARAEGLRSTELNITAKK